MKVKCITDDKEFNSMSEADKFYGLYDGRVSELCKSGDSYKGLSFEKLEDFTPITAKTHKTPLNIKDKREYDKFTRIDLMRCGDCFLDDENSLYMFIQIKNSNELHCINLKTRRLRIIKLEPNSFLNKVNYKIVLND